MAFLFAGAGAGGRLPCRSLRRRPSTRLCMLSDSPARVARIVLASDICGPNTEATQTVAALLSTELSCPVDVPDLFVAAGKPWPESTPSSPGDPDYESWRASVGDPLPILQDALRSARADVSEVASVALVGFCFGAGRVMDLLAHAMEHDRDACPTVAVAFYPTRFDAKALAAARPGRRPPVGAKPTAPPLLVITGDKDPLVPQEGVLHFLNPQNVEIDVRIFEGVGHGFAHRPDREKGAETAASLRAMRMAAEFLRENATV